MSNLQDFEMSSQHKLWHQEHLNWLEELEIFSKEGDQFLIGLEQFKNKIENYQSEIKQLQSAITEHEVHITKHEAVIESKTINDQLTEEHMSSMEYHTHSFEKIQKLRTIYHQFSVLIHGFEHGLTKIVH